MASLNRRQFFQRSTAAAGVAALPGWLARAFEPQDPDPSAFRRAALRAAKQRALEHGKPLLVFVVPDEQRTWARGQRFGSLLNHGGEDLLLDIGMCEPVCGTLEEARAELGAPTVDGDPLLLLIDRTRDGAVVVPIAPELPESEGMGMFRRPLREGETWEEARAAEREHDHECNRSIAAALHQIIGERSVMASLADRCRATLDDAQRERLETFFADSERRPTDELLVRAAAVVRMAAEAPRRDGDRERLLAKLASAVQHRFVEAAVPGSRWAKSTGCGTEIEGATDNVAVGCGMGYVPELCQRFLYFYTR